jgi:hypothetical protein
MARVMVRTFLSLVVFSALAAGGVPALAQQQPTSDPTLSALVDELVDNYPDGTRSTYEEIVANHTDELFAVKVATGRIEETRAINRAEIERTDKQIGATSTSSASTSAVEKPGLPWLLGLAVENGAITQEDDESGVTLSSSPYGVLMLGVRDTPATYEKYDLLRRLGVSATFGVEGDGDKEDRNFDPSSLTQLSGKVVLWGDRNPRSKAFHDLWVRKVYPYLLEQTLADTQLRREVLEHGFLRIWAETVRLKVSEAVVVRLSDKNADDEALRSALRQDIVTAIDEATKDVNLDALDEPSRAEIRVAMERVAAARTKSDAEAKATQEALDELAATPEVSAMYTYHRKDGDADYSELKILAEADLNFVALIGNASVSLNHDDHRIPSKDESGGGEVAEGGGESGKKRDTVRDFSLSVSIERKIPNFLPLRVNATGTDEILLSLSGKFMRLEDEEDEIGVAQAKAIFPLATGVDLPVSVTYATRSEYVDEDEVRGNFGISVDTDKLWSLAKLAAAQ